MKFDKKPKSFGCFNWGYFPLIFGTLVWWTRTRARDDTSPIRHFVGKCSWVRLCLFYPFCSASKIKCGISTLQKNLVMSQIIGRVLKIYLLPFFLAVSLDTENSLSAILLGSQQNDVTRSKTKEKVMCFLFTWLLGRATWRGQILQQKHRTFERSISTDFYCIT